MAENNMEVPQIAVHRILCDSVILLSLPKVVKTESQRDACTSVTQHYSQQQKVRNNPMSINRWTGKIWLHTIRYYLAFKKIETLIHATTLINFEHANWN